MWMATGLGLRISLHGAALPAGTGEDFLFNTKLSGTGSPLYKLSQQAHLPDLTIAESILQKIPTLDKLPAYPVRPDSPAAKNHPGG